MRSKIATERKRQNCFNQDLQLPQKRQKGRKNYSILQEYDYIVSVTITTTP